ncbi:hypothetical protein pb186bvf_010764 [Paramecium bursaria]
MYWISPNHAFQVLSSIWFHELKFLSQVFYILLRITLFLLHIINKRNDDFLQQLF